MALKSSKILRHAYIGEGEEWPRILDDPLPFGRTVVLTAPRDDALGIDVWWTEKVWTNEEAQDA